MDRQDEIEIADDTAAADTRPGVEAPYDASPEGAEAARSTRPGTRRLRRRRVAGVALAIAAVLSIGGAGYLAGQAGHSTAPGRDTASRYSSIGAQSAAGQPATESSGKSVADQATGPVAADGSGANGAPADQLLIAADQRLIVKTGQLALQVSDVDRAVIQAQAAIVGMGGEVGQTQVSGSGDNKLASITYRVPAARWDDALGALRKLAGKVLSEQTGSTDVTSQAIDLDARISNLKSSEQALQSIMAKATRIEDVLAVQNQLTSIQGQIEQLTAQSNHLKNQAAMSTLVATFQLPTSVITTATNDWTLGAQVDEAIAALVHVGQGLATVGIWLLIVALPVGLGVVLVLGLAWLVLRRLVPQRRPAETTPAQG